MRRLGLPVGRDGAGTFHEQDALPVAGIGFAIGDGRSLPVATGVGAATMGRAAGTDYLGEARALWRLIATRMNGSRQG